MADRAPPPESVYLANCDQEPIHIPGSIQPHGVLLAVDPAEFEVIQLAGDTERLLGLQPSQILGHGLLSIMDRSQMERLCAIDPQNSSLPRSRFPFEMEIVHRGSVLDATIHQSDGILVVEFEPAPGTPDFNALTQVQNMLIRLQETADLSSFLQSAAEEVRAATGFDRVMVYRFQEDDSGVVIAEDKAPELEPYLGQYYPASDIPKQARELYLRNRIRLIPDAGYTPAPITPAMNPVTGRPLDLAFSVLRSVSPVHLEYLANMGVVASMSLSVVIGGKLWGLLACHHRTPRYISRAARGVCELFTHVISLQLGEKLANEAQGERLRMRRIQALLIEAMAAQDRPYQVLIEGNPNLLDYMPAGGTAISWEGELTKRGTTPTDEQLASLVKWLNESVPEGVFVTDCLATHYPPAKEYANVASGLLALSVSRAPRDYLLWFRPELCRTVTWAGNPAKPVDIADDGVCIGPRKSFVAWQETVRGRSQPWPSVTLEAAHEFRTSILEVILRHLDQVIHEREQVRRQQDLLMAELDHRVKNAIAITQALVRGSAASAQSLEAYKEGILERLNAMARTHGLLTKNRWQGVDLRNLVAGQTAAFSERVSITGAKLILRPKAALSVSLALHELATNAAKYGALSAAAGRVEIDWSADSREGRRWLTLRWVEQGGPSVEPPSRVGFGRLLLERVLSYDLDGKVDLDFRTEGLICTIKLPFDTIAAETQV